MSRPPESDEDNVSDLAAFRAKKQHNAEHPHTRDGVELGTDLGTEPGRDPLRDPGRALGLPRETANRALRLKVPPATPRRFTVRVELVDSEPAIWRRLQLPSHLSLDVMHDVLQAAFGWADSHLHRFSPSDDQYGWETEAILTQVDIAEGEDGIPEVDVRLDQLLDETGDTLYYTYDFGDSWVHRITLESAQPAPAARQAKAKSTQSTPKSISKPPERVAPEVTASADRAVTCIAGERLGPPEDVGGIHWYQHLLGARTNRGLPDHDDLIEQLGHYDLYSLRDEIDLAQVNRQLDRAMSAADGLNWVRGAGRAVLRPDILELVSRQADQAQRFLAGFLYSAELAESAETTATEVTATEAESTTGEPTTGEPTFGEPTTAEPGAVEPAVAESATSVIRRFLGLVGEGITLTAAGYLPPKHVAAMMAELDPDKNWFVGTNREARARPLLALREAVTDLGLTRKYRGRLLLTKRGAQLKDDPVALWRYLTERLPVERTTYGREFGLLLLMLVAAGEATSSRTVQKSLDLLTATVGWQLEAGRLGSGLYGNAEAIHLTRGTADVLEWGATGVLFDSLDGQYSPDGRFSPDARYPLAAPQARRLARAALRVAR